MEAKIYYIDKELEKKARQERMQDILVEISLLQSEYERLEQIDE